MAFAAMFATALTVALSTTAPAQTDRFQNTGSELDPTCQSIDQSINFPLQDETITSTHGSLKQSAPQTPAIPTHRTPCDNSYTPVIKSSGPEVEAWKQITGARYRDDRLIRYVDGFGVPFDVNFQTVAFRNTKVGMIAGTRCRESPPDELLVAEPMKEQSDALRSYVEDPTRCERVPTIWRYTNRDHEGPILREVYRSSTSGYIAQIAWLDDQTALAVGGTGRFVDREAPISSDEDGDGDRDEADWVLHDERHGAGMARAWIYENGPWDGAWREHSDAEIPDEMRGLFALGVQTDQLAYVGGLRQIWEWRRADGFVEPGFTDEPDSGPIEGRSSFHFRVRAIVAATAYTGGCCAEKAANNFPRSLTATAMGGWSIHPRFRDPEAGAFEQIRPMSIRAASGGASIVSPDGPVPAATDPLYPEPPSFVTAANQFDAVEDSHPIVQNEIHNRAGVWLPLNFPRTYFERRRFTSLPYRLNAVDVNDDTWSVGALPSGQAIAQRGSTRDGQSSSSGVVDGLTKKSELYRLSSYPLNGIDGIAGSGVTWAVGDYGAILVRGENSNLTSPEPEPPKLGSRTEMPLSDRSAFENRELSSPEQVGLVPAIIESPIQRLDEPVWVYSSENGLNEPPSAIVMSRDGSEGWATTTSGNLYHYEGHIWARCDPDGNKNSPPDPECAGVRPKIRAAARIPYESDSDPTNDSRFEVVGIDPGPAEGNSKVWRYSNGHWRRDDASAGAPTAIIGGTESTGGNGPFSLAFTSPTEGWAVTGYTAYRNRLPGDPQARGKQQPRIFRYLEGKWIDCAPVGRPDSIGGIDRSDTRAKCADWNDLLPYGDIESAAATGQGADGSPRLGVVSAGRRIYFYATRSAADPNGEPSSSGRRWPLLLYRDPGSCTKAERDGCWRSDEGGVDPGCESRDAAPDRQTGAALCIPSSNRADQGGIMGVAIFERADGRHEGWIAGSFGSRSGQPGTALMHLDSEGRVRIWNEVAGAPLSDYGLQGDIKNLIPVANGEGPVGLLAQGNGSQHGPLLRMSPEHGSEVLIGPWGTLYSPDTALAGDGQGGLWAWIHSSLSTAKGFYHYTNLISKQPFEDAAHPFREPVTAIAGSQDGTLWAATGGNKLYRYDRVGGWERTSIPGWDPQGVQTSGGSPVNAIAAGPHGSGIVVGPGGRIADIRANGLRLDPAAGTSCASMLSPRPPCGTSRDLKSAALAPDGSAFVGGERRTLLWRPAGGEFRTSATPETSNNSTFTSISYPTPDRAYLATDSGQIFFGTRTGESWGWMVENLNASGSLITRTNEGEGSAKPLRQLVVDEQGHGYATATDGTLYERVGEGSQAWREIAAPFAVESVAIPVGRGEGVLLGGPRGQIATGEGNQFGLARNGDPLDPISGDTTLAGSGASKTIGVAILPGTKPGGVEAWALIRRHGTDRSQALFHYVSDADDPLLSPQSRVVALADSPLPREGEIVFAAFGKSDCPQRPTRWGPCSELLGSNERSQRVTMRIAEEIETRASRSDGPIFALFTGDASDGAQTGGGWFSTPNVPTGLSLNHRRWRDLIAMPLLQQGVPLFGAVGGQDLNVTERCTLLPDPTGCQGTRPYKIGTNIAWRSAMLELPQPWGVGDAATVGSIRFDPVPDSEKGKSQQDLTRETLDGNDLDEARAAAFEGVTSLPASTGAGGTADSVYRQGRDATLRALQFANDSLPGGAGHLIGGARTHYAFDVVDGESEEALARVAVVDTSLRSLAASDAQQNPLEAQAEWLESALCVKGETAEVESCTREPDQPAIVLSNAPTYSYGPGYVQTDARAIGNLFAGAVEGAETQLDAAAFEAILMRNNVSVVISGRIGWNALYWATAPGVHEPCPGGSYPNPFDPPEPGRRICGQSSSTTPEFHDSSSLAKRSADLFRDGGVPIPREVDDLIAGGPNLPSAIPFVISSSAGGKLADPSGDAANGFWSGYAMVRVAGSGDPERTIVEQRPIFDWVGIAANEHTLLPGQKLKLTGIGREVVGLDHTSAANPFRYDEISTPAITHRYELLAADPGEPWLPKLDPGIERESLSSEKTRLSEDPCGPYVCLDTKVGTIDDQSGEVRAGSGKYPDTYAIALLSVGDHSATWPLVFKRSPAFVVNPVAGQAQIPSVHAGSGSAPQPPAPPSPAQPTIPPTSAPNIPAPPPIAPLSAAEPPEPQPPAPPAPPPPSEQPSPLNLTVSPTAIAVSTPAAVIQPPTPPVNPAPPSGARREARQRQAATQKSGADAEGGSEIADAGGDKADAPQGGGFAFARSDRRRPEPSFTALARADQPSAWAQGALYTGGITLIAAALALGWSGVRPTPRRGQRVTPAPGWARARQRR